MPTSGTPNPQRCGKCGAALSVYAPDGLCAACLLESAFEPGDARTDLQSKPAPLLSFSDYELLEEIARGGMGVIYRARQISLNRIVAIKMILGGHLANAADMQRFRAEAETAAQLQHPNIVAIHEVGEHAGQPYFSMDLVEGRNLAQLVRDEPLLSRKTAAYLKTIAKAVQYAHSRGVLHRDLKPSNILIDGSDQPRITDFGLAKRFVGVHALACPEGDRLKAGLPPLPYSDLTQTGQVLGSPSFIPPEQAAGGKGATSPASDVYSLGAILYHCLTARPPFVAETMTATLRMVAENEAVSPRLLNVSVPRDLETICLKCLEKDPRRRYATAQELADELGRFLRDEPIRARPVLPVERLGRWCQRHPAITVLTVLVGLLLATIAAVSTMSAARLGRANREGQENLRESLLAQARANRWSGRPGRRFDSLEAIRKAAAIRPGLDLRNEAVACMALADLRPLKEWAAQNSDVFVFDADYKRYATTNNNGNVVVRSAEDDRELAVFPNLEAPVHSLAFSPNGEFVAVGWGAGNYSTRAYDASTGAILVEFTNTSPGAFCFSPDSRLLAIAHQSPDGMRTLQIYDLQTHREVNSFQSGLLPQTMKFSPTGDRLALASANASEVQILDARNGAILQTLDHAKPVSSFDWHPQGDRLAVAGHDRLIHIWSFSEREQRKVELNHGDVAIFAFYSHQGNLVASIGWDNLLRLWNPNTAQELLNTAALGYRGSPFSADDHRIAYWPARDRVRMCEVAAGLECHTLCFGDTIRGAFITDFSPDGQLPALVLRLHLRLWDETGLRDVGRVPEDGVVAALHFPLDKSFFTAGENGLKRWPIEFRRDPDNANLKVGSPEIFGPSGAIQGLWRIRDGQQLLALHDRTLHLLDIATRHELKRISLEAEGQGAAASQNGKWFVTMARDAETARVWDIESGRTVAEMPAPSTDPPISYPLAFTPDSRLLVTGSRDGYAAWQSGSWKQIYSIRRADTGGTGGRVAFSADGTMGAVTDGQNLIRLFDPATGHEFATLEPPEPSVIVGLIFSPDGGQLVATTDFKGMHYWDLRLIRSQLARMRLDWDSKPIPPPSTRPPPRPLQITFLQVATEPRDSRCTSKQIDLATYYNCTFTNFTQMTGISGNDLAPLSTGFQSLAGTDFDVRGVIQLLGHKKYVGPAPVEVKAISLNQSSRALNFLHSCLYADANGVPRDATVGEYLVRYTDGRSENILLKNGDNIADWWEYPPKPRQMGPGTVIAWRGQNAASQRAANNIVLYKFRWENPHPDTPIATLDFKSALIDTAPFLIAITAE